MGGTPHIVGVIRSALVFQLKDAMGIEKISKREQSFYERAIKRFSKNEKIIFLGHNYKNNSTENQNLHNLPIFSFLVLHSSGRMLHHNFVGALFNDLFGIQLRGGCMCAGTLVNH